MRNTHNEKLEDTLKKAVTNTTMCIQKDGHYMFNNLHTKHLKYINFHFNSRSNLINKYH